MTDRPGALVWRSSLRRCLVILGLSGFAISQPLFAVLGDNPATLTFHHVDPSELVVFALLIAFVPPLLLIGIGFVAERINSLAGRIAHLAAVAGLATVAVIQWAKALGVPAGVVALLVAVTAGAAFTIAYVRVPVVTAWTSYTAFLPLLAVVVFLVASPSSALLQTAATPDRVDSDAPSVVMIVLDELPTRTLVNADGQLDRARYPSLTAFADDATWYRHHTSQAPFTEFAVPSLLTGDEPRTDPPTETSYPDNLFSLLAPTHDLEAMEVSTRLCAYEGCAPEGADTGAGFGDLLALARDVWVERVAPGDPGPTALDDFNEEVATEGEGTSDEAWHDFVPDEQEMRAISVRADTFRSTFDADDPRTLYYLHLLLPHQPWRFRGDGALYRDSDPLSLSLPASERAVSRSWSEWDSIVGEQRHILQTQYVDALLGQILGDLRANDLYDDSLIIITADHGVSFELRSPPRVLAEGASAEDTLDAIAYTPLLVKLPGQASGGIDDTNVMAIDVLPTIADALGIELPFDVDGVPIGSPGIAERGDRKWFHDIVSTDTGMHERGILQFDDADLFATVPNREVGPLSDVQDPLSGMNDRLSAPDVIGAPIADVQARGDPVGALLLVNALEELEHPTETPFGAISGRVEGIDERGVVLLAVDGTVVAGSEISTASDGNRRVMFLLPDRVLDEDNTITAYLWSGDTYRPLELAT